VGRVLEALENAYSARDPNAFVALLHPDFSFGPSPVPNLPWRLAQEERAHRRMFRPLEPSLGLPVPPELHLLHVSISLSTPTTLPAQSVTLEMSRRVGLAWAVRCDASVLFETAGETDYQVNSIQHFIIAEAPDARGAYRILQWSEMAGQVTAAPAGSAPGMTLAAVEAEPRTQHP
jgi:hypothetical protein